VARKNVGVAAEKIGDKLCADVLPALDPYYCFKDAGCRPIKQYNLIKSNQTPSLRRNSLVEQFANIGKRQRKSVLSILSPKKRSPCSSVDCVWTLEVAWSQNNMKQKTH